MKLSTLLIKLGLTFSEIKAYEPYLNFTLQSIGQELSDSAKDKIIEIYNNEQIQKQIKEKQKEQEQVVEKKREFNEDYLINGSYKFLANVKWYFDKSKNGEYGFVEHNSLGDIFFRKNNYKGKDPMLLRENEKVVVTISQKELYYSDRLKAKEVHPVLMETDIKFLLLNIEELQNDTFFQNLLDKSEILLLNATKLEKKEIIGIIENLISKPDTSIKIIKFLISLVQQTLLIDLNSFGEFIVSKCDRDIAFLLWSTNKIQQYSIDMVLINLANLIVNQKSNAIDLLQRISKNEQNEVLENIYKDIIKNEKQENTNKLIYILNIFNELEIIPDTDVLSDHQKFILWYDEVLKEFPLQIIIKKLRDLEQLYSKSDEDYTSAKYHDAGGIIDKIDEENLKNLIASFYYEKGIVKDAKTLKLLLFIISYIKSGTLKTELLNTIYNKSSDYCKLILFVEDYTDEIDYDDAVLYTGLLSSASQKIFFKKIIKLIAEEKLELGLDDLNRILTIDYSMNELSKEIDGVGLDFSLSVILKLISDLKNNVATKRNDIFELIAKQIKRPDDLLVIGGFFDECSGRTTIKSDNNSQNNDEKEATYSAYKTDYKPRFSTYCDGAKSVQKGTDIPNLCNKSGLEFWWCENSKCYDICRKLHNTEQWKNYTLGDILTILKIPYTERQIEILLNVINKVNRFLAHLTCRSCKTILRPKGKSKYAFYGVTWFKCTHSECEKKDQEIYLSHCLNGHCSDIIDSRDTVKCKSKNHKDECGWYICKNCYSCCSSDKLEARKNSNEMHGIEYECHLDGHKDQGIICCDKCGNEMTNNKVDVNVHKQMLNWFIEKRDNHPNIVKSGKRANGGKWWFLWQKGEQSFERYRETLKKMRLNGFNIPDFDDENKTTQLVAEPFNDIERQDNNLFTCTHCHNEINLADNEIFDFGRVNAIKKYHNKIFSKI